MGLIKPAASDFRNNRVTIESKPFYTNVTMLALPIALQSFIASSLNLVDNLMVGSLGETELASVGIGVQLFMLFWSVLFGFTSGCNTFTAQFWGVRDLAHIRQVIGFALTLSFSAAVLFFVTAAFFAEGFVGLFTEDPEAAALAVQYIHIGSPVFLLLGLSIPFESALRAIQQPKIPLYISIAAFSINTFLNYVLIFGKFGAPQMGVAGAALATLIARSLELLLVIYAVFVRRHIIAGPLKDFFRWDGKLAVRVLKNSMPTTINEAAWGLGMASCNMAYAQVGITAYAAVRASNTIFELFIMFAFSLGDATLIILGERLGRGERDYAIAASKKLIRMALVVGLLSGLILILAGHFILGLFEFTPEGRAFAFKILVVYGCTMWIDLYSGLHIVGVLRAGGDTKFAMLAEVGSVWLIAVPMAFIATSVWHLPIYVVMLLVRIESVAKSIVVTARWFSCKWANTVIKGI